MIRPVYHRQSRTPTSEQYQVLDGEERLGHLDIHYGAREVFATLVLDRPVEEDDLTKLIEQIDEDLVLSSEVERDNFFIRVYQGHEVGFYSDEVMPREYEAETGDDDEWDEEGDA